MIFVGVGVGVGVGVPCACACVCVCVCVPPTVPGLSLVKPSCRSLGINTRHGPFRSAASETAAQPVSGVRTRLEWTEGEYHKTKEWTGRLTGYCGHSLPHATGQ